MEKNTTIKCKHCDYTLNLTTSYIYPTNFYSNGNLVGKGYSVYCPKCEKYTEISEQEFAEIFKN